MRYRDGDDDCENVGDDDSDSVADADADADADTSAGAHTDLEIKIYRDGDCSFLIIISVQYRPAPGSSRGQCCVDHCELLPPFFWSRLLIV